MSIFIANGAVLLVGGRVSAGSTASLTGLTDGDARIGSLIGYTITPDNGTETVKWGTANDDATYGTGSNPQSFVSGDGGNLVLSITDGGITQYLSAPIRYAPGSVTESSLSDITIDDDAVDIDFASDFTTTNLDGSFAITGLPTGVVDDGDGTASGTATGVPGSFTPQVVFTDKYGRTVVGDYAVDTVYRAQATAGAALGLSFVEDSAISSTDLAQNFTENGNTMTYLLVDTPPAGLSASAETLTGTPTDVTADANYTFQGTDEYGRVTSVEHAIEITPVSETSLITFSAEYVSGGSGSGPTLNITDLDLTITTGPYTFFIATHAAATTLSKTDIEDGGGNEEDRVSFSDADGEVTGQELTLSTSLSGGRMSIFIRSSDDPVAESAIVTLDSVNVDATVNAPTSVSGTKTGATTATWAATLDEADGTLYAAAYEDGDTAPSAAQIIAGTGGSIVAADSDTTPTADGTNGGSFTGLTGSTTYRVATVYVDDWGNTSAVATSAGTFTTDAAATSSYSRLASQFSSANTTNPSFTIDLSGFLTGDRIIVWTGNVGIADSATFNGSPMTKVAGASNATGNLGEYITCFEYVLTADGDASETVEFTLQATRNEHFLCAIVTSRSIVDSDVDSGRGVTLSGSVTPLNADNIVVAVAMSESQGGGLTNWVGATERNEFVGGTGRYAAIADAEDVAVSATTVSVDAVTPGSNPDMALSILVLE